MNESLITPEHSKTIARHLFLNAFPESGRWFDLAWETALARPLAAIESTSIRDGLRVAGTAATDVKEMTCEFTVLFDAFLHKFAIAQEALIECLDASCTKHGKNNSYKQRLQKRLKENLEQQPSQFITKETSERQQDMMFVERLENGKYFPVKPYPMTGIKRLLEQHKYDFVIDEPNDELTVEKGDRAGRYSIVKSPGMGRGTLWLVLTHVGTFVSREDMKELFRPASPSPDYYQYRHHLGKLIGENLRDKLMEEGGGQLYKIPKESWSFLWLRKTRNWNSSLLRHLLPKPVTK
jgi:hypothetical protein